MCSTEDVPSSMTCDGVRCEELLVICPVGTTGDLVNRQTTLYLVSRPMDDLLDSEMVGIKITRRSREHGFFIAFSKSHVGSDLLPGAIQHASLHFPCGKLTAQGHTVNDDSVQRQISLSLP